MRGRNKKKPRTYKFEKERILPQGSNASSKSQHEHHHSNHKEEPYGIKATQVCDGGQIGKHALGGDQGGSALRRKREKGWIGPTAYSTASVARTRPCLLTTQQTGSNVSGTIVPGNHLAVKC